MPKKIVPIKYTSRDFDSIKDSLIDYVKRYYPETFRDFSEASFGSLMLDTVSYVGDVLSFYLDYQANECFLDTAVEYDNVVRIGRQLGYKFRGNPSSYGVATFFILRDLKKTFLMIQVNFTLVKRCIMKPFIIQSVRFGKKIIPAKRRNTIIIC